MNLSIAIPTYNRSKKLVKLLDFIEKELKSIYSTNCKIEIIISDNASSDNTIQLVKNHNLSFYPYFKLNCNTTNIGLVGNLKKLASLCSNNSDFVWFMGDDDVFLPGILLKVINALSRASALVFINHYVTLDKSYSVIRKSSVNLMKPDFYSDGKNACLDIWDVSGTSLMFISAVIYRKNFLKEAFKKESSCDLASPLFYSFYCASLGSVFIIKECMINNVWGDSSWSSKLKDVIFIFVPRVLDDISKCGYGRFRTKKMKFRYVFTRRIKLLMSCFKRLFVR